MNSNSTQTAAALSPYARVAAFVALWKPRLSLVVAFSSAFGYLLATTGPVQWPTFLLFFTGGFLVSGAAVAINQILEVEWDAIMDRTKNRPIPSGKVTSREATVFAAASGVAGIGLLWVYSNPLVVALSVLSLLLYAYVYTPLKRVGPISVFVGAIPGALPPLIGWVAATGSIEYLGLLLFAIQFIWQFPHFWAIAWVADDDYKKAGFKMLPNGGRKDFGTAVQIMIYTLFLLPLSLLPARFGLTGVNSAFIAVLCGTIFLAQTFWLMKDPSRRSALKIMFGSFLYLPIVQLSFVLDKV